MVDVNLIPQISIIIDCKAVNNATAHLLTRNETRNKSSEYFRVSVAKNSNYTIQDVIG